MNRIQRILEALKEELKISSSNPNTFEERWSFTSSRMRIISLVFLILLFFGVGFTFLILKGPFASFFSKNDRSIERDELEKQEMQIQKFNKALEEQSLYIANLQKVILGQIKPEELKDKKNLNPVDVKNLNSSTSVNEIALAEKVKEDMRTGGTGKKKEKMVLYQKPIEGTVSQKFNSENHPAVDVVAKKDAVVKACASGVILYSGYTKEDGFFIILDHGNESQSIYKHNKVNLKKAGQRVQVGDPIAIVGNTGENSTGPHLHFELWFQQKQINPQDLIQF